MKFHFHEWEDIECENSGECFQEYVGKLYRSKLIEDFKGLLDEKEMVFPNYYTIGKKRISSYDSYGGALLISNFIYHSYYYGEYKLIEPFVKICVKCMKFKIIKLPKNRLKKIYSEFYKQNMVKFISKSKKIKLTIDGIKETTNIEESAGKLDTLTVFLKQMNAIHQKENEILKLIKLI